MTDRPDIPPEMGVLAAEYVLCVMSEETRAAFEQRLRNEPGLLEEVRSWETYFATLADLEIEAVPPPSRVLQAVEAEVFGTAAAQSLWDRVAFWRGLGIAGLATSAALATLLLLPDAGPGPDGPPTDGIPPGTILMTHLVPTEGSTLGLAVTREPNGAVQVRRVAGDMAPGRAQEMWLIVGDAAPVSLGLLSDEAQTTLEPGTPTDALFRPGAVLAISDEPPGGSPTGAPTGAVLALGTLVAL